MNVEYGPSGRAWFKIVGFFLALVALTVVLFAVVPEGDAVHTGYLVSMLVFGIAVVATALAISRMGQRAAPSRQGPELKR